MHHIALHCIEQHQQQLRMSSAAAAAAVPNTAARCNNDNLTLAASWLAGLAGWSNTNELT
jgi:hypothetical protein